MNSSSLSMKWTIPSKIALKLGKLQIVARGESMGLSDTSWIQKQWLQAQFSSITITSKTFSNMMLFLALKKLRSI